MMAKVLGLKVERFEAQGQLSHIARYWYMPLANRINNSYKLRVIFKKRHLGLDRI